MGIEETYPERAAGERGRAVGAVGWAARKGEVEDATPFTLLTEFV